MYVFVKKNESFLALDPLCESSFIKLEASGVQPETKYTYKEFVLASMLKILYIVLLCDTLLNITTNACTYNTYYLQ